ncbi:MAG: M1 family metallopeptidase [Pseudomonadota bacterium]
MVRFGVLAAAVVAIGVSQVHAQAIRQTKGDFDDKFRQLDEALPTPNVYRNAAGAPGYAYWQQEADYKIDVALDEDARRITGSERITYKNNSPDELRYLWLQLDQNIFRPDSIANTATDFAGIGRRGPATSFDGEKARLSMGELRRRQFLEDVEVGHVINGVKDAAGRDLPHTIVGTLMRIDLPRPLRPNQSTTFEIDWAFNMVEENAVSARNGYEHFPDDEREGGNDIFLLAQWFPRMIAYSDYEGWHNKEFLGRGEFTLEFGDYEVAITAPADHIVASTGELQNPGEVLTTQQRRRLQDARDAEKPVYVVTPEEALENEKEGTDDTKTWRFRAQNVRDFAWASSRKFIWDAQGYEQGGDVQPFVMAMSFFPKEGDPLWSRYSTQAVIHTMEEYSKLSFDYPYPTAQSVNGPVGGMEYPMITFNGPRTTLQDDGERTYSLGTKTFLIGVVIHEIGHIYFPMTVNSDERQWTWMDEGLNTFLEGVAEMAWNPDEGEISFGRIRPEDMVPYMTSSVQVPIMTQSDSVLRLGPNAYGKPAVALHILRETVLGRELFDFAFREYSRRWAFKRPTPSDFFRTMEEASGVDLDWFWRGWFYTTDHVDISLDRVYQMRLDTEDPDIDFARDREDHLAKPENMTAKNNEEAGIEPRVERLDWLKDFYNENDRFTVTNKDRNKYKDFIDGLEPEERAVFERAVEEDRNWYVLEFSNVGGLVMPIILGLEYADGETEKMYIPAEIWRRNPKTVRKLIESDKEIVQIVVDPNWETADSDIENNYYPRRIVPSRVEAYKRERNVKDMMQDMKTELKTDEPEEEDEAADHSSDDGEEQMTEEPSGDDGGR